MFEFAFYRIEMDKPLLSTSLLRQLEQLEMLARRYAKSALRGERRSRSRGHSVEFADYRNYVSGDDLRYLDWSLYGRLDRLFVRLYEEERELPVQIFLDASQSMSFGKPRKFDFARRIAAALSHVALCGFDRVSIEVFPNRDENKLPQAALRQVRGRASSLRLMEELARLSAGGSGQMNETLRRTAIETRQVGIAMLLSDFLDAEGFEEGLKTLVARGFQVLAVQVLSREELSPTRFGELKFVDSESGAIEEASFGKFRLKHYQAYVRGFVKQLQGFCHRRGIGFWSVLSDQSLEDLLLRQMKEGALWR